MARTLNPGKRNLPRMAISLATIARERVRAAPRVVLYGPQKIGKSTFAAGAPQPVFIPTEDGLSGLEVDHFPLAKTYQGVLEALGALYEEAHTYQTVVVDSLDWLEPLIWARVCQDQGQACIEDFGYGKGDTLAVSYWQQCLEGLNALRTAKGMGNCSRPI